jgi:phosphoglycolate phosphatase-like HAD superfamily hydrolase
MKYKAYIFDFDGVICDSVDVKTKAFATLYESYGNEIRDKVVEYHLAHGGISRFEKIKYYQTELIGKPVTELEINKLAGQFAALAKEKVIQSPYLPGAYSFISENYKIFLQFICTGTPEAEILEIVQRKKIARLFKAVYGSPKKKTAIIKQVLVETGLQPKEVLYFGDALTDYDAATECKIPFVGFQNEATVFPDGTFVVKDFTDEALSDLISGAV